MLGRPYVHRHRPGSGPTLILFVPQSVVPTEDEDEDAEPKPAPSKAKPAKKSPAKAKRVDSDEEVRLASV